MQIQEQIVARPGGYVVILRLTGKMTLMEGGEQLKKAVDRHLGAGGQRFVLDLEHVPYMDGAGLGELVRNFSKVERAGGMLKLRKPNQSVRERMSIAKLLMVLKEFDDEQQAIESFAATAPSTAAG